MGIIFVPIFIRERSDEEIRREMERDSEFHRLVEEDERRQRERKRQEEERKRAEAEARRRALEEEYDKARRENWWDYQFLPEGWSIFGQTNIGVITEPK